VCLILALNERVVPDYILNIADDGFPFTGVIGLTNLVSPEEVNGLELVYVPKYVTKGDPLMDASDEDVLEAFFPPLQRIFPELDRSRLAHWFVRRAKIVQPLQTVDYSASAPQPDFTGPVTVVNNSQLLETDLHNSMVIRHARAAARQLVLETPARR
jgi:protoporphyrinogen oxidase